MPVGLEDIGYYPTNYEDCSMTNVSLHREDPNSEKFSLPCCRLIL